MTAEFQFESGEKMLPLAEAVETWYEPEMHYNISTLRTWATKGANGLLLPSLEFDGKLRTSQRALEFFFARRPPTKRAYGKNLKAANGHIPAPATDLPMGVTLELDAEVRGALNAMADHLGAIRQSLDDTAAALSMLLDHLAPSPAETTDEPQPA